MALQASLSLSFVLVSFVNCFSCVFLHVTCFSLVLASTLLFRDTMYIPQLLLFLVNFNTLSVFLSKDKLDLKYAWESHLLLLKPSIVTRHYILP